VPFTEAEKADVLKCIEEFAGKCYRNIGFAFKDLSGHSAVDIEADIPLVWLAACYVNCIQLCGGSTYSEKSI
jgi:hypothetical protein